MKSKGDDTVFEHYFIFCQNQYKTLENKGGLF